MADPAGFEPALRAPEAHVLSKLDYGSVFYCEGMIISIVDFGFQKTRNLGACAFRCRATYFITPSVPTRANMAPTSAIQKP